MRYDTGAEEGSMKTPIDKLLEEQQRLRTPVASFSDKHDAGDLPDLEPVYRDLIPLSRPESGEQYAFEVNLDQCTGCKSCVTACHSLNGLEDHETWRDVGLIHGGSNENAYQQTITSACHHCVDPGCMNGCPVLAYEKDDVTGIVSHLDDQCIGCQYCILKCPYDVPKYSEFLGIVRKCDMCQDRLDGGEAPACVQACPTLAISIVIVDKEAVRVTGRSKNQFLAGAPDPATTLPSTRYVTEKDIPRDAKAADQQELVPEHAHLPLVVMLVLTQMALGCFSFAVFSDEGTKMHIIFGMVALLLGIFSSAMHLGRPLGAWRAFLGLKKSWLSREIVVFGALIGISAVWTVQEFTSIVPKEIPLGMLTIIVGMLGVFCSAMIYDDTKRPFWHISVSGPKFIGTTLILGLASCALIHPETENGHWILFWMVLIKLGLEGLQLRHANSIEYTPAKKSALLMLRPLARLTQSRFVFSLIPLVLISGLWVFNISDEDTIRSIAFLSWAFLIMGEMFERILFFKAVAAPKMPGGVTR